MGVNIYQDSQWKVISGSGGSNLTLTNGGNNRVITATGAAALTAEDNLTFDGTTLTATELKGGFALAAYTVDYTLDADDVGKVIRMGSGSNEKNVEIKDPAESNDFIEGNAITIVNASSNSMVIKESSDSVSSHNKLYLGGTAHTGDLTLSGYGIATIILVDKNFNPSTGSGTDIWIGTGSGLS